nr:chloride channel protein 1 [Ipomoea batatas]
MSLVDYASSDEEEDAELQEPLREKNEQKEVKAAASQSPATPREDPPPSRIENKQAEPPSKKQALEFSHPSQPSELKLPDASFLLNSPSMPANLDRASDHSSRVAAAMAENATKKRDLSGPASSSYPRSKVPKGPLPHMKNFPDTVGGNLLPPQLAGRSNVVTEDISKLFVRKQANSSS